MSDSPQLVSGLAPPRVPDIVLPPPVSQRIGIAPAPPTGGSDPATTVNPPATPDAAGVARSVTGGMTMGGRPPDTVMGAQPQQPATPQQPIPGMPPIAPVPGVMPQQPSQPSQTTSAFPAVPEGLGDYTARVMKLEGTGKDPRSNAVAGFMPKTWVSVMRNHFKDQVAGMSEAQILALRSDRQAVAAATAAYAADNAGPLHAAGFPVTESTTRLAHFLGPQGAIDTLRAPPNTPMEKLVSADAIAKNPGSLAGNTAGGVIALMNREMSGETPHDKLPGLREVAFGGFNAGGQSVIQRWQEEIAGTKEIYASGAARSEKLHDVAMHEFARWEAERDKPPQNMHEAWKQWGTIASAFALLGGIVGHNHTAALSAAGAMLGAANAADEKAYDRAYKQWSDHMDRGMKVTELLLRESRNILEDARKPYTDKLQELNTLSTMYQLKEHLDPESVYSKTKDLEYQSKYNDVIRKQTEDKVVNDHVAQRSKEYSDAHGGALPPATEVASYRGEGEQLIKGMGPAAQERARKAQRIEARVADLEKEWRDKPENKDKQPTSGDKLRWHSQAEGEDKAPTAGRGSAQATPDPQQVEFMAKGIAEYRLPPVTGYTAALPYGRAVMQKVLEINPKYQAGEYRSRYIGETRFTTGKQGDTIRSFGASVDHLGTMEEAGIALANDDVTALNKVRNAIRTQFGYEGPVDFNFVKQIVGAEITKAILGNAGTGAEREELSHGFDAANSPEQLAGVARMAKKLMAGQLKNLRQQASSIGWDNERFDKQLSPDARKAVQELEGGNTAPGGSGAPDIAGANLDGLMDIIKRPDLTLEQRQQIDSRLKALGH